MRAGGKHNDLDNVGYTARHHTFFEMLGNFSFGDYFKERAILLAWQLLTRDYALDRAAADHRLRERRRGSETVEQDRGATGREDHPHRRLRQFLVDGRARACGPCSEIFYDHGPSVKGGPPGSADADGDRFVEIWNFVFMQYEQLPGRRVDLPQPSIDTGMGLERIAAVLQGTYDNYEIDLFCALIAASVSLTGVPAKGEAKPSHRVIADHLRASSFLIADGVLPSITAGATCFAASCAAPCATPICLAPRSRCCGGWSPRSLRRWATLTWLERGSSLIVETLKLEETRFRDTLERGLRLLDNATKGMPRGAMLPGETAFKLYDTYGSPSISPKMR